MYYDKKETAEFTQKHVYHFHKVYIHAMLYSVVDSMPISLFEKGLPFNVLFLHMQLENPNIMMYMWCIVYFVCPTPNAAIDFSTPT